MRLSPPGSHVDHVHLQRRHVASHGRIAWRYGLRLKQEKDGELPKLALFQAGDLDWEGRVRKDIAGALDRLGCKGALM